MILRIELISLFVGLENKASKEHNKIERITANTSNSCLEYGIKKQNTLPQVPREKRQLKCLNNIPAD